MGTRPEATQGRRWASQQKVPTTAVKALVISVSFYLFKSILSFISQSVDQCGTLCFLKELLNTVVKAWYLQTFVLCISER